MPAVSLRDVVERLRQMPERERMAWLRYVFVDDAGHTQENLVQLAVAMAQGMAVAVPVVPEATSSTVRVEVARAIYWQMYKDLAEEAAGADADPAASQDRMVEVALSALTDEERAMGDEALSRYLAEASRIAMLEFDRDFPRRAA